VKVLPCNHLFHCGCIVPWLEAHSQACPMCNAKLTS
jgi:E3 ubiquitin-protein ligase RNF115/126